MLELKPSLSIMKNFIVSSCIALAWLFQIQVAQACLTIKVAEPKIDGQKAIVKLRLRSTLTNAIGAVRAVVRCCKRP